MEFALESGWNGLKSGSITGFGVGTVSGYGYARQQGINPWTGAAEGGALARYGGILRDAAKFKGNYELGKGTASEALELGKSWVGKGYTTSSNRRFFMSKDGLRQFQIPNYKPKLGKFQSNFYWKNAGQKQWQSNGHFNIIK